MDTERLNYMVNQIARNLAALGPAEAEWATAKHILEFWEPRMVAAFEAQDRPEYARIVECIKDLRQQLVSEEQPCR